MNTGNRETRDQHGEASEEEDGATDSKAATHDDEPVLVEDDHQDPDCQQCHPCHLRHLECPGHVRHGVEDDVRERRILVHVRNSVMHHRHHHSSQPGDEQSIQHSYSQLPALRQRIRGNVRFEPGLIRLLTWRLELRA